MKIKYLLLALCFAVAFPACALSASAANDKVMTNVKSDNMVYDAAGRKIVFSDNVKVTHPDFILDSDRLQLFLTEESSSGKDSDGLNAGRVQRIIAESNVHVKLPEGRIATCSKATYNAKAETLTMEGNPVLKEGQNQLRGERMVFYLRENRNEVQGKVAVDFVSGDNATKNGDAASLGKMLGGGE